MKVQIKNVSGAYLNVPPREPLAPGELAVIEITKELLAKRVDTGLYEVVKEIKPPAPKRAIPRKKKVMAHSTPGKSPKLNDMLR